MVKKILITGGLGYVGGRIASFLRDTRTDVKLRISTRRDVEAVPEWVRNIEVCSVDYGDISSIERCINGCDTIIHLAAANEIESHENPVQAVRTNVLTTYDILRIANNNDVKRFVYFSTYHVYDLTNDLVNENSIANPWHPYAVTHLAAEGFVKYFKMRYGIETLIFRLSNCYGSPLDIGVNRWSLAFNDICRQVVETAKIHLNTSGKQHRDFISLCDVARAVDHFLFNCDDWQDGLFNLGGECSMSICELARRIGDVYSTMTNSRFVPIDANISDYRSEKEYIIKYSIEKLKRTKFRPIGNLDDEIKRTVELIEGGKHG